MKKKLRYRNISMLMLLIIMMPTAMAQQHCRIVKMITPQQAEYHFQYDTQRRLQTIASPAENLVDSFFYYQDSMVIARRLDNAIDSKIIYTLAKNGQVLHQTFVPIGYEGWTEDIDYVYKENHLVMVKRTTRAYNQPAEKATVSTERYTWKNGNPIKIQHYENGQPAGSLSMQYSADKIFRIGDYYSNEQIMTGMKILVPRNLVKTVIGPETNKVSYEFDSNGNIISMAEKEDNETRVTRYEYECL